MMDGGTMIKFMVLDFITLSMEIRLMESFYKVKDMEQENINIAVEIIIRVNGIMILKKEKEP